MLYGALFTPSPTFLIGRFRLTLQTTPRSGAKYSQSQGLSALSVRVLSRLPFRLLPLPSRQNIKALTVRFCLSISIRMPTRLSGLILSVPQFLLFWLFRCSFTALKTQKSVSNPPRCRRVSVTTSSYCLKIKSLCLSSFPVFSAAQEWYIHTRADYILQSMFLKKRAFSA